MNRCRLASMLLASALPLHAADAPRYAWEWPIELGTESSGAVRLRLDAEVYARITRDDLTDLAVFNARGDEVPFGPIEAAWPAEAAPTPQALELPWFRVARAGPKVASEITVRATRAPDGSISTLEAVVGSGDQPAISDILIDAHAYAGDLIALDLDPGTAEGVNTRLELFASEDLIEWRPIAGNFALIALRGTGDARLRRTRLTFEPLASDYLLLRSADPAALDALVGIRADPAGPRRALNRPALQSVRLDATEREGTATFRYRVPGPIPTRSLDVQLADGNSVAQLVLHSRAPGTEFWQMRGGLTAFRIVASGEEVSHDPLPLGMVRDREWRIEASPALAHSPRLELSFEPEEFLLLPQGDGPYRLRAGSGTARRADYPLATLVNALRARLGPEWIPPLATLGPGREALGAAALALSAPERKPGTYALWAILIAAALAIVLMVLRLLKQPAAPP